MTKPIPQMVFSRKELLASSAKLEPVENAEGCYIMTLPNVPINKVRAFLSTLGSRELCYQPLPHRDQEELALIQKFAKENLALWVDET